MATTDELKTGAFQCHTPFFNALKAMPCSATRDAGISRRPGAAKGTDTRRGLQSIQGRPGQYIMNVTTCTT